MRTFPSRTIVVAAVMLGLALLAIIGCGKKQGGAEKLVIGLVAKSQSNPVFQAAYTGARDAAREFSVTYQRDIVIDWQTPPEENAQKQAEAIEQIARSGAQGIAVSCSDVNILTPAINKATDLGSTVICFDSDAPASKRFRFFGTDDITCGAMVMKELARIMNDRGTIAILAGNQSAPNLQNRVKGVLEELKNHPGMTLLQDGIFYHPETPEQAAETMNRAQTTNPSIEGWALVGGWPLYTRTSLRWKPGDIKVVSVDALPAQLTYLESGHVQTLLAQNCYMWGYTSVDLLLKKILKNEEPAEIRIIDPLTPVTSANLKEFQANWSKWLGEK
jgi:ribose transport system substrate-binding protein